MRITAGVMALLLALTGVPISAQANAERPPVAVVDGENAQASREAGKGPNQNVTVIPSGGIFSLDQNPIGRPEIRRLGGGIGIALRYGKDPMENAKLFCDTNKDGLVVVTEVLELMAGFYETNEKTSNMPGFNPDYDFNLDNVVNIDDYDTLLYTALGTGDSEVENNRQFNAHELLDDLDGVRDGKITGGLKMVEVLDDYYFAQRKGPTAGGEGYAQKSYLDLDFDARIDEKDLNSILTVAFTFTSGNDQAHLNAYLAADTGDNGFLDITDFAALVKSFNDEITIAVYPYKSPFDFNRDGVKDSADFDIFIEVSERFLEEPSRFLMRAFLDSDFEPRNGRITFPEIRKVLQKIYKQMNQDAKTKDEDFNEDGRIDHEDLALLAPLKDFMDITETQKLAAHNALDTSKDGFVDSDEARNGMIAFEEAARHPSPGTPGYDLKFDVVDPAARIDDADRQVFYSILRPIANAQSLTMKEDGLITIVFGGSDPNGGELTFILVTDPKFGDILNFDAKKGVLTYRPAADYSGTDLIRFKVTDGSLESEPAEIKLDILPVNDRPVGTPIKVETTQGAGVPIKLTGSDVDGDKLKFEILTRPDHGILKIDPMDPSKYVYTPNVPFTGKDFFMYRVFDGQAYSDPVRVDIIVKPAPAINVSVNIPVYAGLIDLPTLTGIPFNSLEIISVGKPQIGSVHKIANKYLIYIGSIRNLIRRTPYVDIMSVLVRDNRSGTLTTVNLTINVNAFWGFPGPRRNPHGFYPTR